MLKKVVVDSLGNSYDLYSLKFSKDGKLEIIGFIGKDGRVEISRDVSKFEIKYIYESENGETEKSKSIELDEETKKLAE